MPPATSGIFFFNLWLVDSVDQEFVGICIFHLTISLSLHFLSHYSRIWKTHNLFQRFPKPNKQSLIVKKNPTSFVFNYNEFKLKYLACLPNLFCYKH